MVLGYDEKRPRIENYFDFISKFTWGIQDLGDDISLMVYGSYIREDDVPGRSDIDAVLVFPDEVIIDKEKLKLASMTLAKAQKGNNIPFQVTVTDIVTIRDG